MQFFDVFFFTPSAWWNWTEKFHQHTVLDAVSPTILIVVMAEYFLFWFLIIFNRLGCVNVLLVWSMWKWQFNLFGYVYVCLYYIYALNTLLYDNKMNGMSEPVAGTITRTNGKLNDDAKEFVFFCEFCRQAGVIWTKTIFQCECPMHITAHHIWAVYVDAHFSGNLLVVP